MLLQPLPGVAAPGDWFSDDFETGTLRASDSPPGRWDTSAVTSPNTFGVAEAGAHRGRHGLTVVDRSSTSGTQANAAVEQGTTLTSEVSVRTWMRIRGVSAIGTVVALQAMPVQVELRLQVPGPNWELAVRTGSGRTYASRHGSKLEVDRWYLVEFTARGLGTDAGEVRFWVDGVEQGAPLSRLDWRDTSHYVFNRLMVGEPWSDTGTFTGSIDFDDVRVSAAPMASRLELQRPANAAASAGCLAVDVSLRNPGSGALAPAPYETDVALAVAGGEGGFHADAACASPVASLRLPSGTSERRVYFRPVATEGKVSLRASHPDFLSATLDVDVEAGAGSDVTPDEDEGQGPWTTDLGCASVPGALVALPVLLVPWLRRRRASRFQR